MQPPHCIRVHAPLRTQSLCHFSLWLSFDAAIACTPQPWSLLLRCMQDREELPQMVACGLFSWDLSHLALRMPKLLRLPYAFDSLSNLGDLELETCALTSLRWAGSQAECKLNNVTALRLTSVRPIFVWHRGPIVRK
jgi:hypothetical protein